LRPGRSSLVGAALAAVIVLLGCAQVPGFSSPQGIAELPSLSKSPAAGALAQRTADGAIRVASAPQPLAVASGAAQEQRADTPRFWQTPPIAPSQRDGISTGRSDIPPPGANDEKIDASVNLESVPLPVFANTVYATILKKNVSLDPSLQKRTDLISLRTGQSLTARQLSATAASVLRSYGVVTLEHDGLVRLVPDTAPASNVIELMRSRSQPDVPARLRPVFHFYELQQANVAHAAQWIRSLFQARVTITEDTQRNALLLSGQSDAVASSIEALEVLDQPYLRGRHSARISPVFWSAQDLAVRLGEVLSAQGIYVGNTPNLSAPLLLLPIPQINSVIVFGTSPEMVDHALRWARDLDRAPQARRNGRYITYNVRNTDAKSLASTLNQLMGNATAPSTTPGAAAPPAPTVATTPGGSRVVVNASANSIILQTTPDEYAPLRDLLMELDRPPRSALIMVTIAEVGLTESEQFGFNWLLKQFSLAGYRVNGNVGGAGSSISGGAGLNLGIAGIAGDPRAFLSALASTNRVRVLSNPSIVALNGEQASIQVGQDVPVLTSQISGTGSGNSSGGQNLLQSVQYRNVGIILNITPTIHSAGRVELKVAQEVSGVSSGAVGVGNSPIFTTRRVDTKLSALDGQSTLIGGLIREQRDDANSGVPIAKDVPVLGGLFRSGSNATTVRTELVILLTPYIIEDDVDAQALTEAFRNQFSWLKDDRAADRPIGMPNLSKSGPDAQPKLLPSSAEQATAQMPATPPAKPAPPASADRQSEPEALPYVIKPLPAAPSPATPSPAARSSAATPPRTTPSNRETGSNTQSAQPSSALPRPTQPSASQPRATASAIRPSALQPPGKEVTDADLLRQLRNAIEQSPSQPARPAR
jgi:general secretion pathway protein D